MTTKATHTPGPWTTFGVMPDEDGRNPNIWVAGPGYPRHERTVCLVHRLDEYAVLSPDPEAQANARLIAAAPTMLAVCEEIADSGCDLGDSERRIRLYAAIAAARQGGGE